MSTIKTHVPHVGYVIIAFCGISSFLFAASPLRVGVAQEKITPNIGSYLGGYWRIRIVKTVKSDLYAKAIVLEVKGKKMAIVSVDLIGITPAIAKSAKELITNQCGIAADAIMVCATHTHTGPEIRDRKDRSYSSDPKYNAELIQKIAVVVKRACDSMFNGNLYVGQIEAKGYSVNRYVRLKDGRDKSNYRDLSENPPYGDDIIGYASPMDNSVQTLCVKDLKGQIRGIGVNFAAHPNAGKKATYVWAEWPGDTAERIAEEYGEDVPCLLLQGAAGDVHCTSKMNRQAVGRGVAEAAIKANSDIIKPMPNPVLDWRMEILKIPYCSRLELAKVIAYYRRKKDLTAGEKGLMNRLIKFYKLWDKDGKTLDVPVQCLRIGDVAIVGLPGEPFTALSLEIKQNSPAKQTFVVGYANSWKPAYIPPADQTQRGGYGERPCEARYLIDKTAKTMVDSALNSLRDMWK
jgi:hypothetical protein